MKYCPNPECEYARKFKRPGEYTDVATACSDCGVVLVAQAPKSAQLQERKTSDANERLAVTLLAGVGLVVLSRLPLLGTPSSVFGDQPSGMVMLAAGMVPFITSFTLVECTALVFPQLSAMRVGGPLARRPLDRIGWILGFVLLAVQLAGLVNAAAPMSDLPPPALLWPQFVLAHLAMLGLGVLVTRRGLGNGFGLVLAISSLQVLISGAGRVFELLRTEAITLPVALAPIALTLVAAFLCGRWARSGRGVGGPLPTTVPFPISSVSAWVWAGALMSAPATLALVVPFASQVEGALRTSQLAYTGLFLFLAFDVALMLGLLFYRPKVVGGIWARWVPRVDETGVIVAARAMLPWALGQSIGLTVGLPALALVFASWARVPSSAAVVLVALPLTCALLDIVDEFSALQRLGPLVSVWEVQRTAEAEPVLSLLRTAGIEGHARSFLLRVTQQLFTPWIPVGILVPVAREAEARALIAAQLADK